MDDSSAVSKNARKRLNKLLKQVAKLQFSQTISFNTLYREQKRINELLKHNEEKIIYLQQAFKRLLDYLELADDDFVTNKIRIKTND